MEEGIEISQDPEEQQRVAIFLERDEGAATW